MPTYLLDTDHVTLHQRGDERVRAVLDTRPPHDVGVTIITIEEQLRGRLSQTHRARTSEERVQAYSRLRLTVDYFASMSVFDFDLRADERYRTLRSEHSLIGTQDLKIAAIALTHDAIVVTRNRLDFDRIPGLRVEDWSV